jgi:hypothetical protein
MEFNGEVLERGFWLYVWEVLEGNECHLYVGRTGDSYSPNASSPFNRIGQHLDFRENAKGATLAKRLKEAGINPNRARFRMLALGPFFPEQKDFEAHRPYRDKMATLEFELAEHLKQLGHSVLGVHHKGAPVSASQLAAVKENVEGFLSSAAAKTAFQPSPKSGAAEP